MATLTQIEMYSQFRKELDRMYIPMLLKDDRTHIYNLNYDGKTVGLLCVCEHMFYNYIDCIYIEPEYRREGIARNAVLRWYRKNCENPIRLHILNNNKAAKAFWNELFVLEKLDRNSVNTLYRIVRLKEE